MNVRIGRTLLTGVIICCVAVGSTLTAQAQASPTADGSAEATQGTSSSSTEDLPEYSAFDATNHIGETAIVIGRVKNTVDFSHLTMLVFGEDSDVEGTLVVRVPKDAPGPKLEVNKLIGVLVAVTGEITRTQVPTIKVTSTSQIVTQRTFTAEELEAGLARADKAVKARPDDAKAYYRRGLARQKKAGMEKSKEGYNAALEDYNHSFKLDPTMAEAMVRVGDCYAALQDYGAAKKAWDKAIEASPRATELLKDSNAREQQRRCYAAIHDLDKLTDLEPNNAALYFRKANLYLMDDARDGANENFRIAAALEPTNSAYTARAAQPVGPSKGQMTAEEMKNAAITGLVAFGAVVLGAAVYHDIKNAEEEKAQRERVRKLIAESGGKKIECPKCNGRGKISVFSEHYDGGVNPYPWYSQESKNYTDIHTRTTEDVYTCGRCQGIGVVDR